MSSSAVLNPASIPERIHTEVQRTILQSIKCVEYFSTSGPAARLDAERCAAHPRHHAALPLPAACGRDLPCADPDRDGD